MVKYTRSVCVKNSGIALCCLTVAAGLAHAQASAPSKFCVIQAEAALVSTKDGQAAVAELEKTLNPKKTALQKQQADIQEMQDKLQKGANTLSQTAKDEQSRAIDAANKKFNRDVEDYNAEAENAQRKAMDGLTGRMKQVIDLYAKDHGCAVVFNVADQNTPIVYACDSCDITTAVVDMYDKTQTSAKPAPAKPVGSAPSAAKPPAPTGPAGVPPTPQPGKKQP
jgi:Skp family chaperone for outer membrane proteins